MPKRKTRVVEEGKVKLKVPALTEGELPEHAFAFYNPEMVLNRDISVATLSAFKEHFRNNEKTLVCDALSATGIRALRYRKECGVNVVSNDFDKDSTKLIKSNVDLNKLKGIEITKEDANVLLASRSREFHFIDIDPFGPPVYFYTNSANALCKQGMFAATATDTAALNGVYPHVALRKYGVESVDTDFAKELGLRIMVTSIVKSFARFAVGFTPVLCHVTRHYFRVYGLTKRAKTHADEILKNLEYLSICRKCNIWQWKVHEKCVHCNGNTKIIGPIWSGPLQDKKFCGLVLRELAKRGYLQKREEAMELVHSLIHEADAGDFYYDIHKIAKRYKWSDIEKMNIYLEKLRNQGFKAERTHMNPYGIKTTADYEKILELNKIN